MKKFVFIILALAGVFYLTACAKKQQSLEEMQEPMSMEAMTNLATEPQVTVGTKTQVIATAPVAQTGLEPQALPGPAKPTNQEIQTALQNAGFYTGVIDGKIGPLTKKATEEFQKAKGLKVDGKVGPQTWAVLSAYLNPVPQAKTKKR